MNPRIKLRGQDIILTAMLGILIFLAHDASERALIGALTALQLIEGRIPVLSTTWGRTLSALLQLAIVWVLIGYTHGVESHYYLMMLLPLVSTASFSGLGVTLAVSIAGVGAYLSFCSTLISNSRNWRPMPGTYWRFAA